MSEIKIRKGMNRDLKDIQSLNQLLFIKEQKEFDHLLNNDWPFQKEGEEYFAGCVIKEDMVAFVAEIDDEVIGYIAGRYWNEPTAIDNAKIADLGNFFVLPKYRNQGIGTKLVREFIDWAKSKEVKRIVVTASTQNTKGINFYRKNGFVDHDTKLKIDL